MSRYIFRPRFWFPVILIWTSGLLTLHAQSRKLTPENISRAIDSASVIISRDPMRPAFHLTPPAGCMGDPNGGIYHNGWYHILYGLNPFSADFGGWYWAHARSRDLLHWEHMEPGLTPAFELGLSRVGSGSVIINEEGKPLAFYSTGKGGSMKFWRAEMTGDLNGWSHDGPNPVLTLDQPEIPEFNKSWRDPFVFETQGRTFMIACAGFFEEEFVPVPIFEGKNAGLTEWEYKGILFTYPKHKHRNFEVPELRPLGDKWVFLASCDAPVDRTVYFTGDLDIDNFVFTPVFEGILDYSGHYYAQETIQDDQGNLFLMAWIPGWDRRWMPNYRDVYRKNTSELWNGCFAIPRQLSIDGDGALIQQPVGSMKQLRGEHFTVGPMELPVHSAVTGSDVLKEIRGNQLEAKLELELGTASFCGLNVLCDDQGKGGLYIMWSGDVINVGGVKVPVEEWDYGDPLQLQIFIDKQLVEIFVNGGRYCITRQVKKEYIKGDRIALTRLGGIARLRSLEAWKLNP